MITFFFTKYHLKNSVDMCVCIFLSLSFDLDLVLLLCFLVLKKFEKKPKIFSFVVDLGVEYCYTQRREGERERGKEERESE